MRQLQTISLTARDLGFFRNEKVILSKVNFTVGSGQLLYIKGHNGSGKTTLLKILINLVSPDTGEFLLDQTNVLNNPIAFARECLYIGHRSALKPELTAEENLAFLSKLDGEQLDQQQLLKALHYFDLSLKSDAQVKRLSAGQQRKTALARLVFSNKTVWILDEPFTSIDANSRDKLVQLFEAHLQRNGIVITTSHQSLNLSAAIDQLAVELTAA